MRVSFGSNECGAQGPSIASNSRHTTDSNQVPVHDRTVLNSGPSNEGSMRTQTGVGSDTQEKVDRFTMGIGNEPSLLNPETASSLWREEFYARQSGTSALDSAVFFEPERPGHITHFSYVNITNLMGVLIKDTVDQQMSELRHAAMDTTGTYIHHTVRHFRSQEQALAFMETGQKAALAAKEQTPNIIFHPMDEAGRMQIEGYLDHRFPLDVKTRHKHALVFESDGSWNVVSETTFTTTPRGRAFLNALVGSLKENPNAQNQLAALFAEVKKEGNPAQAQIQSATGKAANADAESNTKLFETVWENNALQKSWQTADISKNDDNSIAETMSAGLRSSFVNKIIDDFESNSNAGLLHFVRTTLPALKAASSSDVETLQVFREALAQAHKSSLKGENSNLRQELLWRRTLEQMHKPRNSARLLEKIFTLNPNSDIPDGSNSSLASFLSHVNGEIQALKNKL
jgi:hypothetical protein